MIRPIADRKNKDHFGFYLVDDFKTYSKLEAIEYAIKTNKQVKWSLNQQAYDQFDWTVEPPESLEYWYKTRAEQLRDKYDYIVLFYSGGADSYNVLDSFVKNNIFIDEITQFHFLDGTGGDKYHSANGEVFFTAAPETQSLIQNNPVYANTKNRLIDMTSYMLTPLGLPQNKRDWFYMGNNYPNPLGYCMSRLRDIEPDYRRLADQGKRVCFLWGVDKPRLSYKNKQFYIRLVDTCLSVFVNAKSQVQNDKSEFDEAFYWTPDLPELIAKQAHVMKNFIEKMIALKEKKFFSFQDIEDETLTDDKVLSAIENAGNDENKYSLPIDIIHRLIYPTWNPEGRILCPKPPSPFFGGRSEWVFRSNAPRIGQDWYGQGVVWMRDFLLKNYPQIWWEKPFDKNLGHGRGGMHSLSVSYPMTR